MKHDAKGAGKDSPKHISAGALMSPALLRTGLIVICFAMAIALGNRLYAHKDMTELSHHTLNPQSIASVELLADPLEVEVFINPHDPQSEAVTDLLGKFQAHKKNLNVTLTDPALDPTRMRSLNVAAGGEIFLHYQNRTQRLTQLSEQSLTLAMQRLVRADTRRVIFTVGHGERTIDGDTNADLSLFAQQLADSGFELDTINISEQTALDANSGTLVIAGPMRRFLANEVVLLLEYISNGGNLIWLTEPASDDGLDAVAVELGIERLPGVVIDVAAQQLQVERPDFAIVNEYSRHPATEGFTTVTLFPQATGLDVQPDREWQVSALVQSGKQAWTETGALNGKVAFGDDPREVSGPFPLVFALERDKANKQQRVIVSGDGDFLADAWVGNGGNRDLGNRLFNWSADDNAMIGISAPTRADAQLNLSRVSMFSLAGVALLLLPGLMFSAATGVWYRRQHG